MYVQPYLMFAGNCEQALEFYKQAAGAQVQFLMRYSESPEKANPEHAPPGSENMIMHASFTIGDSVIMASDDATLKSASFKGFYLSISVKTAADADKLFATLSPGGQIFMPLGKTFWTEKFAMFTDKFGVPWMINVEHSG